MKHTLLFLLMICACTLQATATGKQPRLTDDEFNRDKIDTFVEWEPVVVSFQKYPVVE